MTPIIINTFIHYITIHPYITLQYILHCRVKQKMALVPHILKIDGLSALTFGLGAL